MSRRIGPIGAHAFSAVRSSGVAVIAVNTTIAMVAFGVIGTVGADSSIGIAFICVAVTVTRIAVRKAIMARFTGVTGSSSHARSAPALTGLSIAHGVIDRTSLVTVAFFAAVRTAAEAISVRSASVTGSPDDIFAADALTAIFLAVLR